MDRIRGPRDKHPSGKPLRRDKKLDYADGYRNQEGPRVARLRNNCQQTGEPCREWSKCGCWLEMGAAIEKRRPP